MTNSTKSSSVRELYAQAGRYACLAGFAASALFVAVANAYTANACPAAPVALAIMGGVGLGYLCANGAAGLLPRRVPARRAIPRSQASFHALMH